MALYPVTPYSHYWRFEGTYCLSIQDRSESALKMEAVGSSSSGRVHGVTAVMNIVLSYCGKVKMHRSYPPYSLQTLAHETSDEAFSNSLAPPWKFAYSIL